MNRYEGQWVKDKKDGYGIYTYVNSDRYEGQFSKGNMHGQGIFIFANGDQLVGKWLLLHFHPSIDATY
jgi:hypothetical protein